MCGTSLGWTSPEIPLLKGFNENPLTEPLTDAQESWVGALLPLAAAIGPFAAGLLADKIGRKKTLLLAGFPCFIAFAINCVANSVNYFYISRLLCGLSAGIIFTVLPMYIGEISDDDVRGSLGSFMQLFIVIGLLFSYALGPYLSVKVFNIILLLPPIFFLITFFVFIPESPYYLILRNDVDAAEEALCQFRSKKKIAVQKELETYRMLVKEAQDNKASFFDIFKSRGLTMALFLSTSLIIFQQFSGINVVLFYAQTIFAATGVSLAPEICTIIIGIVQVIGSALTPLLVEKRGKRFLLLLSSVGMAISLGSLAGYFYVKDNQHSDVSALSWLPITSLILYIFTYCLGFGPLPWAVMGELFPGNIKTVASTVTASISWLFAFILTKYFNDVAVAIGKAASFGIFSIFCVIAAAFVAKFLPETSGKSLQEIQDILCGVRS